MRREESAANAVVNMRDQKFIVGGEWRSGTQTVEVRDPHSGAFLAAVHQADEHDCRDAVISSKAAFDSTRSTTGYQRAAMLRSVADGLRTRKEECARLIVAEAGKPVTLARAEVDRAISTFTLAAEEATRMYGEVVPLDIVPAGTGKRGIVNRFPIGIILCITPFNFPLNLVAHKLAPAIAAGNSFVLKPAPQTPLTAMLLGEILLESGIDRRTVNILPASNTLAEKLVTDDRIAMVSFTGSAAVGWKLKSIAGKKKIALELGGNAAVIVGPDADIPSVVSRCVAGAFGYAGQVCIKVQRIIVHSSIASQFESELTQAASAVFPGDPSDEKTMLGPMISETEACRVESWVNEAIQTGASVLTGGTRTGRIYQPTVLTNVSPAMKVCSEELFGPVVTVEQYSTIEEAVTMINRSRYGLQAGIFTNDHHAIQYSYQHLEVGGVIVNDYPTFRADNMPYGGVKDSGFGREGVRYAMQEMTEAKLLVL